MTRLSLALAAAAAGLGLAALGGTAPAHAADPTCEIRVTRSGGTVSVEPTLVSQTAASGAYRLRLQGSGPSGRTNVSQGGPFAAEPGATRLARTALSAGAHADAELVVEIGARTIRCGAEIRP